MLHVKPVGSSLLFITPFIKDFVGLAGAVRANRRDILDALDQGHSVALCPGGLRELPGLDDERRHREGEGYVQREGFLKIAMKARVPVVPVRVDAEDQLYSIHLFSPRIQRWFLSRFYYPGFVVALGAWWLPFWPKRKKLTLWIGEPVEATGTGTKEEMREKFYGQLID